MTNSATDPDFPPNTLTFSLVTAPAGSGLHPSTGYLLWSVTASNVGTTNLFAVRVTDNGSPPLSVTNTFVVVVTEANSAPTLPGQTEFTIPELTTLVVTNTAADPDVPANLLSYTLQSGPADAVISADGVITSLNPAFTRITHQAREDWEGKPFLSLIHDKDVPQTRKLLQALSQKTLPPILELRLKCRAGELVPVEVIATPQIEEGEMAGMLVIARDIRDRKQAEETLRRLADIVQSSHDAIIAVTPAGEITSWNPGARDLYGYRAEEVVGLEGFEKAYPAAGAKLYDRLQRLFANVLSAAGGSGRLCTGP